MKNIRKDLEARLLNSTSKLPTTSFSRLGRTALTAARSGRMMLKAGRKNAKGEELPLDIDALAAMVGSFGQLKGIAMKMGQIMSYTEVFLPEELRAALSVLQTHSPPMPFEEVEAIIRQELGEKAETLLAGMEREPAAAASIGQVHRAVLDDEGKLAIKVRYPGINEAILADFRPAAIAPGMAALFYPGAEIKPFINEARDRFLEECDYLHEAEMQGRFASIFQSHPMIEVPEVVKPYCSEGVLTSRWVDGLHFDAFLENNPSSETRDRLGIALFDFYLGTLFKHGLYNCDPHPGNYIFKPDGKIAVLDYGCSRVFEGPFVCKLADLTKAVHSDKREELHQAFLDLEMVREDRAYDFDTARGLVRAFYGPMLRDEVLQVAPDETRSMGAMYESKKKLLKLRLPGEFLFLFRIRFGLMSILSRLGAKANWYRLEREFLNSVGTLNANE